MEQLEQQKNAVKWLRILYPAWAVVGMFSLMYVPSTLIDTSDPELTVANITGNELLFRAGIVGSLITQLFSVGAVWFLYKLFGNDFRDAVILMAVFTFLGMPIAMSSSAYDLAALNAMPDAEKVIFYLKQGGWTVRIATIFWGLWLLPLGYMIIRSPLFPSLVGWLVVLAGVGYTLSAFSYFLDSKGLHMDIFEYLTFGEVLWMLWVLAMGARWKALGPEYHSQ